MQVLYQYPVNYISITQGHHNGKALDFGWCSHHHQNIYSVADGKVYKIEKQKTGGNVIFIRHDDGNVACYGHLQKIIVKIGSRVKRGQKIGTMGATGKVSAEHLHFQITSKNQDIRGKGDIDPFKVCYVYPKQNASKVNKSYEKFLKYYEDEVFTVGVYILLYNKSLRKTPSISLNEYKVKDIKHKETVLPYLVSKKPNDIAKLKKGTDFMVREIIKEKNGRIWGKFADMYLVLCNIDNTPQAKKK